jgi:hypothetical protein
MITLTVRQSRQGFFNRPSVIRAVGKAKVESLSRFGAYVRRDARKSIRPGGKKGKVSKPGEPPRSHAGTLKRFLNFAWDRQSQSLVVGPMKTNQVFFTDAMRPVRGTVPSVLERGGSVTLLEEWNGYRWVRRDLRRMGRLWELNTIRETGKTNVFSPYRKRPVRRRTVHIEARPYMGPALKTNLGVLPPMWHNSIRTA